MYSPHATTEAQPVDSFVVPLLSTRHLQLKCPLRHNPLGKELLILQATLFTKGSKTKRTIGTKTQKDKP
jgi:hypothetical protein